MKAQTILGMSVFVLMSMNVPVVCATQAGWREGLAANPDISRFSTSADTAMSRVLKASSVLNLHAEAANSGPGASKIVTALDSTAPGDVSAKSNYQNLRDADYLRSLGFLGDGASHPLSTILNFKGLSTAKFTLAQWQALLPAATSLDDEMDWVSIQSLIGAATGPLALRFPVAKAVMNHAIEVCAQSVAFYGSGGVNYTREGTLISFTGGSDGIVHCASAGSGSKIELHDINLTSTTTTGSLWGVKDLTANYTVIDNVGIKGFNNCAHLVNPAGTRTRSLFCSSGQATGSATLGEGMLLEGQNAFVNRIDNTLMQNFSTSYDFHSTNVYPGPNLGIEDMQVNNSACGGTKVCVVVRSDTANYGPFNYSFTNMSVDATTQWLNLSACNDIVVTGGNWLIDAAVGSWTGGLNMIEIGDSHSSCHMVRLRDMWLGDAAVVTVNALVSVESGSNDVQFSGAHIETSGIKILGSWLQAASGVFDVIERDTAWLQRFAKIDPPSNAVYVGSGESTIKYQSTTSGLPTLGANCGAGAALVKNSDAAEGTIVEGAGRPTSCTMTFPLPNRSQIPVCILFNTQGAYPVTLTNLTTASLTYTHAAGQMRLSYHCTDH